MSTLRNEMSGRRNERRAGKRFLVITGRALSQARRASKDGFPLVGARAVHILRSVGSATRGAHGGADQRMRHLRPGAQATAQGRTINVGANDQ